MKFPCTDTSALAQVISEKDIGRGRGRGRGRRRGGGRGRGRGREAEAEAEGDGQEAALPPGLLGPTLSSLARVSEPDVSVRSMAVRHRHPLEEVLYCVTSHCMLIGMLEFKEHNNTTSTTTTTTTAITITLTITTTTTTRRRNHGL